MPTDDTTPNGREVRDPIGPTELSAFLDRLASAAPTPGGGSAAALAGSMAAGLLVMVGRIAARRAADPQETIESLIETAERHREALTAAVEEDAAAYRTVLAARRLPKSTPAESAHRRDAIRAALVEAAGVPLAVARAASTLTELGPRVAAIAPRFAASDLEVAVHLARAALLGALANVSANTGGLDDAATAHALEAEAEALRRSGEPLHRRAIASIHTLVNG
jgi:formiminotetrahydrofolate cyclodeaminase